MKTAPKAPRPPDPEIGRPPAPEGLEVVRLFINTLNVEKGTDAIASPAELTAWLRTHDLLDRKSAAGDADLKHSFEVREALRSLGLRNNGIDSPTDIAALDAAAIRGHLTLGFDPDDAALLLSDASGVDRALGRLLASVHRAMLNGTWPRLKVCGADTCLWAYYDRSKNGCSRWCSAEVCGNRDKVKRYRERQAGPAA